MLTVTGRFTSHLCSAALSLFFALITVGDWFICISSVLNSHFWSKTRDSRMLHATSIVWWIALAFVGLRELSEFPLSAKRLIGPRRVKSCRTDVTRLRLS